MRLRVFWALDRWKLPKNLLKEVILGFVERGFVGGTRFILYLSSRGFLVGVSQTNTK